MGPFLVDFLWRERRLVVETDGDRFHRGQLAATEDRTRDEALRALGFTVLRFSHRQIADEPERVVELVRARLA